MLPVSRLSSFLSFKVNFRQRYELKTQLCGKSKMSFFNKGHLHNAEAFASIYVHT